MQLLRRTLLAAVCAATLLPAQSGAEAEIRKVEDAWVTAVSKSDAAAVDKILADDLVYTHSTGIVDSKADYLGKMRSGKQKYDSIRYTDQKIRVYGNTAVVNGQVHMLGSSDGKPFDNRLFVQHVWVKQGGQWKLVAHQTTRKS